VRKNKCADRGIYRKRTQLKFATGVCEGGAHTKTDATWLVGSYLPKVLYLGIKASNLCFLLASFGEWRRICAEEGAHIEKCGIVGIINAVK
jgi:hypothetical protein